jgi:beta-galactosidase
LDRFAYFGRGPGENYPDRKRGSDVGVYRAPVRELLTPYPKPTECGNREEVRWARLTRADGAGLAVEEAGALLSVSALPYRDEELEAAAHAVDLPPWRETALCVSGRVLGVGSASCGPRPEDRHIPWSGPAKFGYRVRLLAPEPSAR